MNTLFRLLLLCALGLPIAFPALADSPVEPSACKVPGARRITIGSFQFSAADLQTFQDEHPRPPQPVGARRASPERRATLTEAIGALLHPSVRAQSTALARVSANTTTHSLPHRPNATCGVVDVWLYAAVDAYSYCNAPDMGNGQAYFEVTSPATFNAADHHEQYRDYGTGLAGTCYVCAPPEMAPLKSSKATPRNVQVVEPGPAPTPTP